MPTKSKQQRLNWWKWGFLFLLAANLAFVAVLSGRLLERREPELEQVVKPPKKALKIGSFETNREQLNHTISRYLEDYQTKNLSYEVVVGTTTVMFEGTYEFLGYQVPLYIYFNPYQLEDGRIQMDIASFSVGTLPLPAQDVLRYVKASYSLPPFVTISPKKGTIILDLTKLSNRQGIYLEARQIDLLNDKFRLDILKK